MPLVSDNATVESLLTLNALVTTPVLTASTLNGTLTLVVSSSCVQVITGTQTGYSVVLPSATTLVAGQRYEVFNASSQQILVKTNGGATLITLSAGAVAFISLRVATPAAGVWDYLVGSSAVSLSAGSAGDVQFRGVTPGTFAADATGQFRWDTTAKSLQIGPTGGPVFSNNALGVAANVDAFAQVNAQNLSAGTSASTDFIATADNGTDTTNYVDLGINSSTYSDPAFDINGPGDAYLYASDGNMAVGSASKDFILFAGGTLKANEVARGSAAGYFQQNLGRVHVPKLTATTLNGTITLISTSQSLHILTGSAAGYSLVLPSATTIIVGQLYEVYNQSSASVLLKNAAGVTLTYIPPQAVTFCVLQVAGSLAGTWITFGNTIGTASGLVNYKITASTTFTTASTTDVIITGFTVTPTQGTYEVKMNMNISMTTNNAIMNATIYKNGASIADSIRPSQGVGSNWVGSSSTLTTATFNGTDTCDTRVKVSSGSVSCLARSMVLTRLGN